MFEKEIKFISDFCLNKISKAGSFLTFEKMKGIEIHPAILKYISTEIDFHIYKDRQVLLQKSSFDYSGAEISKYFKLIALEIKRSRRISENEIVDLITKAVTFNVNFITKPNATIINLLFDQTDDRNPEEIILLLDSIHYYSYLKQILTSYFEKKQLLIVKKEELEFILEKIDTEMISIKKNEMVNDAISAISDFFNIGAVLRSYVPEQAMEIYLREKKMDEYLHRLNNALTLGLKSKYESDEIKRIIFSKSEVEKKEEVPINAIKIPIDANEAKQDVNVSGNLTSSPRHEAEAELISFHQELKPPQIDQEQIKIDNSEPEGSLSFSEELKIENNSETFVVNPEEINETYSTELKTNYNVGNSGHNDILSYLSDKEVERVISSIFNEDREDFAAIIESMSECKSYEKSTEILKTVYTTYKINPYSKEAILLTNAVAKYFTNA